LRESGSPPYTPIQRNKDFNRPSRRAQPPPRLGLGLFAAEPSPSCANFLIRLASEPANTTGCKKIDVAMNLAFPITPVRSSIMEALLHATICFNRQPSIAKKINREFEIEM
jgi:hypothetical protein